MAQLTHGDAAPAKAGSIKAGSAKAARHRNRTIKTTERRELPLRQQMVLKIGDVS
jgi:hypothetical protein